MPYTQPGSSGVFPYDNPDQTDSLYKASLLSVNLEDDERIYVDWDGLRYFYKKLLGVMPSITAKAVDDLKLEDKFITEEDAAEKFVTRTDFDTIERIPNEDVALLFDDYRAPVFYAVERGEDGSTDLPKTNFSAYVDINPYDLPETLFGKNVSDIEENISINSVADTLNANATGTLKKIEDPWVEFDSQTGYFIALHISSRSRFIQFEISGGIYKNDDKGNYIFLVTDKTVPIAFNVRDEEHDETASIILSLEDLILEGEE